MNISSQIKLVAIWILLVGSLISTVEAAQDHNIMSAITHLQESLNSLSANKSEEAMEHINLARQKAKNVIGGSFEVQVQRIAGSLKQARRLIKDGDKGAAEAKIKNAIEKLEELSDPSKAGGRGGLN